MDYVARLQQASKLKADILRQLSMLESKQKQMIVEVYRLEGEIKVLTEMQVENAEKVASKEAEDVVETAVDKPTTQGDKEKSQKQAKTGQK